MPESVKISVTEKIFLIFLEELRTLQIGREYIKSQVDLFAKHLNIDLKVQYDQVVVESPREPSSASELEKTLGNIWMKSQSSSQNHLDGQSNHFANLISSDNKAEKATNFKLTKTGKESKIKGFISANHTSKTDMIETDTSGPQKYKCKECNLQASSPLTLKVHIEMKHLNMNYYCNICNYSSKEKYVIKNHLVKRHKDHSEDLATAKMDFKCNRCKTQGSMSTFREHILSKHKDLFQKMKLKKKGNKIKKNGNYKCPECDHTASQSQNLYTHIMGKHMGAHFKCTRDSFESKRRSEINKHIKEYHENDLSFIFSKCTACSFATEQIAIFDFHAKNIHFAKSMRIRKKKEKKKFSCKPEKDLIRCNLCQSDCRDKVDLKAHKALVHGQCQYVCKNCEFRTLKQGKMLEHGKAKHGNMGYDFSCGFCSLIEGPGPMATHLARAHGEAYSKVLQLRLFRCKFCDFQNISERKLALHRNSCH